MTEWIRAARRGTEESTILMLVGNKVDTTHRSVSTEVRFMATSASICTRDRRDPIRTVDRTVMSTAVVRPVVTRSSKIFFQGRK